MKFHEKIAKSIYDFNLDRCVKNAQEGGGFSFYCLATKRQANYISGKSGSFIGRDGLNILFSPYSGLSRHGTCAVSFHFTPQNNACQPALDVVE
jgi:hypothetical protein